MPKHYALPIRRQMNLSERAYDRLRQLNAEYGLGNNYLLTVLLEHYDELVDKDSETRIFGDFIQNYGAPKGEMR